MRMSVTFYGKGAYEFADRVREAGFKYVSVQPVFSGFHGDKVEVTLRNKPHGDKLMKAFPEVLMWGFAK